MFSRLGWRHNGSTSSNSRTRGDAKLVRQASDPSVNRRATIATMYNRNFHQNPDRPWQYYMDSGSKELQQIMQWNRDDSTIASSVTPSDGRSRSTTVSERFHVTESAIQDLVRAPGKGLTKATSSDSMDVDESDDDDRSNCIEPIFCAPEGVNITPFESSHNRINFKHSYRLSSIYKASNRSVHADFCCYSKAEMRVVVDDMSPLRFQGDIFTKFEDMTPTPHNSPIRGCIANHNYRR